MGLFCSIPLSQEQNELLKFDDDGFVKFDKVFYTLDEVKKYLNYEDSDFDSLNS